MSERHVRKAPSWTRWAVLAVAVLAIALIAGRPDVPGQALDPRSSDPGGTRALVLLLDELGAEVDLTRSAPEDDIDVALVLQDVLDETTRRRLTGWVDDGGTLVVSDPSSSLAPAPIADAGSPRGLEVGRACAIEALQDVDEVAPSEGVLFEVEGGVAGCFEEDDQAFVVLDERGAGNVVGVGGSTVFTNQDIGDADNAVLASSLLVPRPGVTVAIVEPAVIGGGEDGLGDLIADNVRSGLWQLVVAFCVYALWRVRRLGPPVAETQPVELAASELVVAVGNLLQQARRRDQAAALLRDDVRRRLAARLGLGAATPAREVAEVAAARSGVPVERVWSVLGPSPLRGDEDLVALAGASESLRQDVARV